MKVLITGACGFIGRNLIRELEASGHDLILADRQRPEEATVFAPGSAERVVSPLTTQWPFLLADIMDHEQMRSCMEGVDAVVHLAASPTGLPEQGVETFKYNALGTFILLDACRLQGVGRFITASSINAFGTFYWRIKQEPVAYDQLPLTEDFTPVPQDPYSLSKRVNEETCAAFHRAYGIKTAALRFGAVWTEEMYRQAIESGLAPTTAWSDDLFTWVHVHDIVTAIRQALEADRLPGSGVYTLNAADTRCPEPTMELLQRWKPEYAGRLSGTLKGRDSLISIERAHEAFGYKPQYRLDAGVRG
ncbi:NAD-dependent epimerase/dehydratase family protein [Paenibacillus sp. GCM10027626]|uniref:NAD-dependent epimerase/dehydratase family protein n=1 Tax=Paenibacillus sp. GCM10027626 TaxID=3273411 RepID=UPI003644A4C4